MRKHYTDLQILEITLSLAGNNAINRWKEGTGVPQERDGSRFLSKGKEPAKEPSRKLSSFLTPTLDEFKLAPSKVAVLDVDASGKPTPSTKFTRAERESRAEVEAKLKAIATRKPRLPLVDEAKAREVMAPEWGEAPITDWVRLLANFPKEGKARAISGKLVEEKGELAPLFKAQVSWVLARQDRAWFALADARRRLKDLGQTDDQIFALDGDWSKMSEAEQAMLVLASKLAASPIVLTDADVDRAVRATSPKKVVQLINYVTDRASFNRISEVAGLTGP